jgi:hypothetical protein
VAEVRDTVKVTEPTSSLTFVDAGVIENAINAPRTALDLQASAVRT